MNQFLEIFTGGQSGTNDPAELIAYLRRSGFSMLQAQAILEAKRMAGLSFTAHSIQMMLVNSGFTEPEAGVITNAAVRPSKRKSGVPPKTGAQKMEKRSRRDLKPYFAVALIVLMISVIGEWLFSSPEPIPASRFPHAPISHSTAPLAPVAQGPATPAPVLWHAQSRLQIPSPDVRGERYNRDLSEIDRELSKRTSSANGLQAGEAPPSKSN